jgi:hypothetical protein
VKVLAAAVLDLVFVVAFVLIGRASHREDLVRSLTTLWPFAVGLLVGWIGARAWNAPFRLFPTGVIVLAGTVIVGLLLRTASGQGIQLGFVIVTAIVLTIFLLGWRAVALLVSRARTRSS